MGRRGRRRETTHQVYTAPGDTLPARTSGPVSAAPLPSDPVRSRVALMIACAHPTKADVARASV
ncbi:hypothetical protein B0H10DRAFT_2094157 [Mycena sp. CBHHK59/15]|nr:hypothetical protein B0H10DRAFT_2094157 [Mycena sp. CBHHK59/15]